MPIRAYTTADGLVSSTISYMMADSHGFLWFCTRDGLSRFDGQQFVTYGTADGLSAPGVTFIIETSKGDYWVADEEATLYRFDPYAPNRQGARGAESRKLFTPYAIKEGDANYRVGMLYEDHERRLWAGTSGGLFVLDEGDAGAGFRRVQPSARDIFEMLESRDGSLWMGTLNGLLRRLPDGRLIHYSVKPFSANQDTVYELLEDRDGRLWVGSYAGLLVFVPESSTNAARGDTSTRDLLLRLKPRSRTGAMVNLPEAGGESPPMACPIPA